MTRMTEKSDHSYSIQNLQQSIGEVMVGEYTPQEIHEVIVDTVKDNMRYYRACYNDSVRLLALLRSNTNPDIKVFDSNDLEFEKELNEVINHFNISRFKLDSPELHNEDED
tara:strand:+ start:65 stop:397 length:333 start_codon:yes stop_codon:yes gene_type:complete